MGASKNPSLFLSIFIFRWFRWKNKPVLQLSEIRFKKWVFNSALPEADPYIFIKKFFDTYERTYSVNVDDFINDLTILPKKKVKQQLHTALYTYYEMKSRGRFGEPTIHRSSYTKKMHEIVDYIFAPEDEKSAEPITFSW